jgi:hypothetical protein
MNDIRKFREAHPDLFVTEAGLNTMAPFASLYANDFIASLDGKGEKPEVVSFVRSIVRELVWAYDGWQKAQRDGDSASLLADMINGCTGDSSYYGPIQRYLQDYAKANAIPLPGDSSVPEWMNGVAA